MRSINYGVIHRCPQTLFPQINAIGYRKFYRISHTRSDKEEQGEGYTYREDTAENRVMFVF